MSRDEVINSFDGDFFFLSNFYPVVIVYDNLEFSSTEHAFQAAKTLDQEEKLKIQLASTPGKAKRLGKKCCLRPDWGAVRINVMKEIIHLKFQIPELQKQLIETGSKKLIEENTWNDTFWGICDGKGANCLGIILMEEREKILKLKN